MARFDDTSMESLCYIPNRHFGVQGLHFKMCECACMLAAVSMWVLLTPYTIAQNFLFYSYIGYSHL